MCIVSGVRFRLPGSGRGIAFCEPKDTPCEAKRKQKSTGSDVLSASLDLQRRLANAKAH
jgi:hypothetical protein